MSEVPIGEQAQNPRDDPKKGLRVAIITPHTFPGMSGNAVTIKRITEGLGKKNVDVAVFKADDINITYLRDFNPHVIHAFHAYKSGRFAKELSKDAVLVDQIEGVIPTQSMSIPLVVTFTGTDSDHDLFDAKKRKTIQEVIDTATVVTCFNKTTKQKITNSLTIAPKKIKVIPQAVALEKSEYSLRRKCGIPGGAFVFFLPAGLRKIKYAHFYLDQFKKLHELYGIHLVIAGPTLEESFADKLTSQTHDLKWVHMVQIPHLSMYGAYQEADAVLNTSLSEGMSNAIMEALSMAKPVLASSIEGNKALIKNNINGLLFKDKREFFHLAQRLINESGLCSRLGKTAQITIQNKFPCKEEILSYLKVYGSVIA